MGMNARKWQGESKHIQRQCEYIVCSLSSLYTEESVVPASRDTSEPGARRRGKCLFSSLRNYNSFWVVTDVEIDSCCQSHVAVVRNIAVVEMKRGRAERSGITTGI